MKRVICFDLDGTLLTSEKKVLEENKEAIKRAKGAGIDIVICTGRQLNAAKRYREMVEGIRYIICTNGAEIMDIDTNDELFASPIDEEVAKAIFEYGEKEDLCMKIDTRFARYITKEKYALNNEIPFEEDRERFFYDNKVLQMSLGAKTEEHIDEVIKEVNTVSGIKVENKYRLNLMGEGNSLWFINIVNTSVSKGNAINGLCRYLKVDINDVVCFGDDLNDLSMIKMVGYPIAMGNAIDIIKENAKEVIEDNNTPGIAKVLDRFIEENKKESM